MSNALPYTIRTIQEQLGRALPYVGANYMSYWMRNENHTPDELQNYSVAGAEYSRVDNGVLYDVGLSFRPNTRRKVFCIVAYEPDDTYTVYLWREHTKRQVERIGKFGELLDESRGVYGVNLGEVVENMYDEYIKKYQQGFIY